MANIDWNGLLNAGLNIYSSMNTANKNQTAAQNYGQQTQFNPYNLSYGNAAVGFNGNNAYAQLSPQYQQIQQQLLGGAGGLLGGLGSTLQNGGINSQLQNASNQYNQEAPGVSTVNPGGQTSISTGMGDQFNNTAQGFLGSLGGFNPQDAAAQYTGNLRAQAQPQNQNAATNLAQNLFNSGRLGSTGGANVFGQLMQAQNQQDLGFQLAGQQYGGQEQNRLAGLAQGFGQLGTGINQSYAQSNNQFQNDAFSRNMSSNQNQFNQSNQRATQRFQNAMSLFGAGQQNMQGQLGAGLGLLQGSQGLDQNLLQAIGLGGQLGSAQSSANQKAYAPGLESTVAKNNTGGANTVNGINSILNGLGGVNGLKDILGGLFGGSGGSSSDFLGGYGGDFSNYPTSVPSTTGGGWMGSGGGGTPTDFLGGYGGDFSGYFNGAGGQAANGVNADGTIDPVNITQSKVGDGSTGAFGLNNSLGAAQQGLGIYQGLNKGGVQGYGQALAAGAGLASNAGLISGQTANTVGAVGNAAAGNVAGAAGNATGAAGGSIAGLSGGQITGLIGGIYGLTQKQGKFAGTANAALAGYQVAGPWGALVGGILGYARNGGVSDANPLKASGFTGISMDQAWQDQNIARLASNPAASVASKWLGVDSNSTLGKVLDPAAALTKHGDEKRNWNAFSKAFPGITVGEDGNYRMPGDTSTPITQKQLEKLSGTWYGMTYHPDGDQEGWQKKFISTLGEIYGNQISQQQPTTGGGGGAHPQQSKIM